MRALSTFSLLVFCVCSTACNRPENNVTTTPSPSPPVSQAAVDEDSFHLTSTFDLAARTEARKAVTDYIRTALPEWTIKGISVLFYEGLGYASVDIWREKQTATVTLRVRKFFPEAGESYWKADPYRRTLEQQVNGVVEP